MLILTIDTGRLSKKKDLTTASIKRKMFLNKFQRFRVLLNLFSKMNLRINLNNKKICLTYLLGLLQNLRKGNKSTNFIKI